MERIAPGIPGGHEDSFCVALSLFLRPETVRFDNIPSPELTPVDWGDPNIDFSRYSASGTIGDVTWGSVDLGARLWDAIFLRSSKLSSPLLPALWHRYWQAKNAIHFNLEKSRGNYVVQSDHDLAFKITFALDDQ